MHDVMQIINESLFGFFVRNYINLCRKLDCYIILMKARIWCCLLLFVIHLKAKNHLFFDKKRNLLFLAS
jgi:hypothetical protein